MQDSRNPKTVLGELCQQQLKVSPLYMTRPNYSSGQSGYVTDLTINMVSLVINVTGGSKQVAEVSAATILLYQLEKYGFSINEYMRSNKKPLTSQDEMKHEQSVNDVHNQLVSNGHQIQVIGNNSSKHDIVIVKVTNADMTEEVIAEDWISKVNLLCQKTRMAIPTLATEQTRVSISNHAHYIGSADVDAFNVRVIADIPQINKTIIRRALAKKVYEVLTSSKDIQSKIAKVDIYKPVASNIVYVPTDPSTLNEYGTKTYPRDYQIEALDHFKVSNIYVPLPTGLGKTLIASLCIANFAKNQNKSTGNHQLAVFVTDRLTLVDQQSKYIAQETGLKVAIIRGGVSVSAYDLQTVDVLVVIAQSFLNSVQNEIIPINRIGMIIIDEAHHIDSNHPFNSVLTRLVKAEKQGQIVRKLFLSATPVEEKSVLNMIIKLSALLFKADVEIHKTDLDKLQLKYGSITKKETKVLYRQPLTYQVITELIFYIQQHLTKPSSTALDRQEMNLFIRDIEKSGILQTDRMEFNTNSANNINGITDDRMWTLVAPTLENLRKRSAIELLEPTTWSLVKDFLYGYFQQYENKNPIFSQLSVITYAFVTEFEKTKIGTKDLCFIEDDDDIDNCEYDMTYENRLGLWYHIRNHMTQWVKDHEGLIPKSLILTKSRWEAVYLSQMYSQWTKNIANRPLRANYLIGKADTDAYAMTYEEQVRTADKYKNGELDTLIATTVIEEGFDVTDCNVVYKVDVPYSVISYVQSRGRVRKAEGEYVLLVESKSEHRLQKLKLKEKDIQNTLFVLSTHTIYPYSILQLLVSERILKDSTMNNFHIENDEDMLSDNPISIINQLKQIPTTVNIDLTIDIRDIYVRSASYQEPFTSGVYIGNVLLVKASGTTKQESKTNAAMKFLSLPRSANMIIDIIQINQQYRYRN